MDVCETKYIINILTKKILYIPYTFPISSPLLVTFPHLTLHSGRRTCSRFVVKGEVLSARDLASRGFLAWHNSASRALPYGLCFGVFFLQVRSQT